MNKTSLSLIPNEPKVSLIPALFDPKDRARSRDANRLIARIHRHPFDLEEITRDGIMRQYTELFATMTAINNLDAVPGADYERALQIMDTMERYYDRGKNDAARKAIQENRVIDSRVAAEMVEKKHCHLMRDIGNYVEILTGSTQSKFGLSENFSNTSLFSKSSYRRMMAVREFFLESSYKDKTGRKLPCYLITRKGCEMVANKMTGAKGIQFTAAYINKFHEMENALGKPTTMSTGLSTTAPCNAIPAPFAAVPELNRLEIMEKNAKIKAAYIYLRIAENSVLPAEQRKIYLQYAIHTLALAESAT